MRKLEPFKFNSKIENLDILIDQLKSLKKEARVMYTQDFIFRRDYWALAIVINFLQMNRKELEK